MAKEKKETEEVANEQPVVKGLEILSDIKVDLATREAIAQKADELKKQFKLRRIFVVLVEGDEDDDKPLYVAYFQRPNLAYFSQYMTFAQRDLVQANKSLAQNTFIAGDRELVDDDELFLYGTMNQLAELISTRNAELVKR